ncbi:PQQ-like beta-propeller repeat protein [Streptomyces coelicoflavus]|uniref:PQQ-like beta-propeller repeat protein n=1 Tax=Streptomyces coelicoflavus TaxID=285562 RepID=A0A7K3PUH4_9ACTN|nr:PQQ-binding-like beta-propeller repeat protein [Streptomyces coelicoflavus]NEB13620.1 PQQ-like beta-propeller repeat protein [Streptomyces coelicoflavus]
MSFGPPPTPYNAPAPDTRPGPPPRSGRRKAAIGAVAAVVLVALAAGLWTFGREGSGGDSPPDGRPVAARQAPDDIRETVEKRPPSPEGTAAVSYEETLRTVGQNISAMGTWATDKVFAKSFGNEIRGFRLGGSEASETAWRLTLPGPLCAVTRHVSVDGRTAIAYTGNGKGEGAGVDGQPDGDPLTRACDRLAVLDIDTGKKMWDRELAGAGSSLAVNVTMTDGTVVTAWGEGSAAYELTGGKRLWADTDPSACADEGFAGGPDLLALLSCGDSADPVYRVQKIDPRTGDAEWTYRVARGVQGVYLVSSSPAVIAVAAGDVVVTDLLSLDERGKRRATIRLNRDHQVLDCDRTFSAVVESCGAVVVDDERLYLSEEDHIVAHDLATGRTAGKFDAPAGGEMHPLRMSGEQLIAYRPGRGLGRPDAVVALDPESGDETLLLLFAGGAEVGALDDPAHNDIVYEHGRVFFAARTVVGPYNEGEVGGTDQVAVGVESAG